MDIQATLLDIADEIERGMSADGATSAAWRQSAFARDAGGAPVPPDADDAVGWCVFGHIRRRETDSILTRRLLRGSACSGLARRSDAARQRDGGCVVVGRCAFRVYSARLRR